MTDDQAAPALMALFAEAGMDYMNESVIDDWMGDSVTTGHGASSDTTLNTLRAVVLDNNIPDDFKRRSLVQPSCISTSTVLRSCCLP